MSDTRPNNPRPRGRRVSVTVLLVLLGLLLAAIAPLQVSNGAEGTVPTQSTTDPSTPQGALLAQTPGTQDGATTIATFLRNAPLTPYEYGAYASTPGGWSGTIEPKTAEAARTHLQEAPQHDPLYLATLTALYELGTKNRISGADARIDELERKYSADQAQRNQAFDALTARITDVRLGTSDRPYFKLITVIDPQLGKRPGIRVEPVLQQQGDYVVVTFDNGRKQKLLLADGAPIIGMLDATRAKHDPAFRERLEREQTVVVPVHDRSSDQGQFAVPASRVRVWERLASCESGNQDGKDGKWDINTGNGYFGGVQFSEESWAHVGGEGLPHEHSKMEQIYRAELLLSEQGWNAWPSCSHKMGVRGMERLSKSALRSLAPSVRTVSTTVDTPPASGEQQYAIVQVAARKSTGGSSVGEKLFNAAVSKDNATYEWGKSGPKEFDCTGLITWAAKQAGKTLPERQSTRMAQMDRNHGVGTRITDPNKLQKGDLVFIHYGGKRVNHAGISDGGKKIFAAKTDKNKKDAEQIGYSTLDRKVFSHAIRL